MKDFKIMNKGCYVVYNYFSNKIMKKKRKQKQP